MLSSLSPVSIDIRWSELQNRIGPFARSVLPREGKCDNASYTALVYPYSGPRPAFHP